SACDTYRLWSPRREVRPNSSRRRAGSPKSGCGDGQGDRRGRAGGGARVCRSVGAGAIAETKVAATKSPSSQVSPTQRRGRTRAQAGAMTPEVSMPGRDDYIREFFDNAVIAMRTYHDATSP